jgi:hypothetical protein
MGIPNTGSNFEIVVFQWDQPSFKSNGPPGCQSELDFILSVNGTVLFSGTSSNIGQEPGEGGVVIPALSGLANSTVFCDMFIIHKSGPFPKYMKLISTSNTGRIPMYEFPSNTTSIVGKSNSALVTAVGSVFSQNTPLFNVTPPNINGINPTFGVGNPILFDRFGNRTLSPTIRTRLRFRAVTDSLVANPTRRTQSSGSYSIVAGIAALMLQAKGGPKSLTPQQISNFLEISAIDMDDPTTPGFDVGFDNATGFGFVDALAALDAATATKAPTKAPTKKPTKAPTKKPTTSPTKVPTSVPTNEPIMAPIKNQQCGFLRLSIFCPLSDTGCGLFKRLFNIDGC